MPNSKHILGVPGGKHIFGTVRVGEKGQIVIPKEARELFEIRSGDTLLILGDDKSGIIVTPPALVKDAAMRVFKKMDQTDEGKDKT